MLRQRPGLLEDILIHVRIAIESLQGGADAAHVGASVHESVLDLLVQVVELAHEGGIAAEVPQVAPDIGHTVEAFRPFPDLLPVAEVVQDQLLFLREGGQIGLHAVLGPVFPLVVEEPAHLEPDGFRIGLLQGLVHLPAYAAQILGLPAGRGELVEDVDAIDMVRSIDLRLLLDELLLDFGEQVAHRVQEGAGIFRLVTGPVLVLGDRRIRIQAGDLPRNVAGEGRQDRLHVQFALPGRDLLLELQLTIQPAVRKRTEPAVDILHPVPRQVRRTGEVIPYLLVGQAHFGPDLVPDGLLARDGQREIDSVQGHPVDEMLPVGPLPPGHRVPVGAVVQEETVFHPGRCFHGLRHGRQLLRKRERIAEQPAVLHMAVVLEIVVQPHGHGVRVIADDGELPPALLEPEEVALPLRFLKDEMAGVLRPRDTHGQRLRRFHLRVRRALRSASSRHHKDGGCSKQTGNPLHYSSVKTSGRPGVP